MNFRKTSKQPLTTPPAPPTLFSEKMLRFFWEARKFATKFIWIGVIPPLSPQKNYRKSRNEIFWIGNDPPPLRKFSENSLILLHASVPYHNHYCQHLHLHLRQHVHHNWRNCRKFYNWTIYTLFVLMKVMMMQLPLATFWLGSNHK